MGRDRTPQANCSGTVVNDGKNIILASHCFRALCPTRNEVGKNKISDYFFLISGKKIFITSNPMHPKYCYEAFEKPYSEKVKPYPLFPEWRYDIAVASIQQKDYAHIKKSILHFPKLNLDQDIDELSARLVAIGYGVSDRYLALNTLWVDDDGDQVHDFWDVCPGTKIDLSFKGEFSTKLDHLLNSNGCSAAQKPPFPAVAMDYFNATRVSHKRGYTFSPYQGTENLLASYRVNTEPFISNHGYRGSLFAYDPLRPMSFGGDSGGPVFNSTLSVLHGVTLLFQDPVKYTLEYMRANGPLSSEETRGLMTSSFNVFLKLSTHKEHILNSLD